MRIYRIILVFLLGLFGASFTLSAQQPFDLQSCVQQALENNHNLKKMQLDCQKSEQSIKDVQGALLPQLNGSAGLNRTLQKNKFIMPNFINSMLPPAAQNPNAPKYMTIEMGTNYSTSIGATLTQQVLNFSLFNALEITKTAQRMAEIGLEAKEEDVIGQVANLYYGIQTTVYAVGQFEKSIGLMDNMVQMLEVNFANGIVKKVDVDRLKVARANLLTQKSAIQNVIEIQKNLLKFQMGMDMEQHIDIAPIDLSVFEEQSKSKKESNFNLLQQSPYKLVQEQQNMVLLQRKSALYDALPVLMLNASYQYNGVCDEFFRGPTNYWYPGSMIGFNMRIPIFTGLSRKAKIKSADIELQKVKEDVSALEQSLAMAYINTRMKLDDSYKTIQLQKENMTLATDVYAVSEHNYLLGISSMADVLNANSSLIQAQMTYADALNNYMKAYIDLKKANGTIRDLVVEKM